MIPTAIGTQTVTVIRPAWVDDHGSAVADWSNATESESNGWSVQPLGAPEILDHRDSTGIRWRAYGPPGVDVESTDRLRFADTTYEVDGEPLRWTSPTGRLDHVELTLLVWEG